ncbi:MAG: S-layer homology domain-containing protein [Chloroflexi bacterium]|nr:S-layer homology domain-containing protein [Chloroflexota bacterium]
MTIRLPRALATLLVAVAMVAPPSVPRALAGVPMPPGGTFMDDNGSIFEPAIEAVAAAGVTGGCTAWTFCHTALVTRAQMAAFLSRALDLAATSGVSFSDVPPGHPFAYDINRLATAGITAGCGGSRFCPDASVTRAQMAAFLSRGFDLVATSAVSFSDVPPGHPFAYDINRLATSGITSGCGGGRFCPNASVTRGQMAAFLQRAMGLPGIDPPPPATGNPTGHVAIPAGALPADVSDPDHVVGSGTPGSCTSAAVVAAVAHGGVITFDCGPSPVTISMTATARVFNNKPNVVIDGGGLVTLDGGDARRIIYMNTCDPDLVWTTSHCQNQDHPTLTVQNITLAHGRSTGNETMDGGGAMFVRGGRVKVVNARFTGNRCASTGPDIGGAALQVFSQHAGNSVYVVNSTFGGSSALRNECSNGGGISSIGVSWTIINSLFADNRAIGTGANPPKPGTPGGGNGGAIYNDGNEMTLRVLGTRIEGNTSNGEGGSAIFFVSNNRTGSVEIADSVLTGNTGDGFQTYPGIFFLGKRITFANSTVE